MVFIDNCILKLPNNNFYIAPVLLDFIKRNNLKIIFFNHYDYQNFPDFKKFIYQNFPNELIHNIIMISFEDKKFYDLKNEINFTYFDKEEFFTVIYLANDIKYIISLDYNFLKKIKRYIFVYTKLLYFTFRYENSDFYLYRI